MKNSKVQLTDLKESNMNQLVASEMFMIRGGGGYKGGKKSFVQNNWAHHSL